MPFKSISKSKPDPIQRSAIDVFPKFVAQALLGKPFLAEIAAKSETAFALIIHVPNENWMGFLADGLLSILPGTIIEQIRPGRRRSIDASNNQCLDYLADGRSVVAITYDPSVISKDLQATADRIVEVEGIDVRVVRRAINAVAGERAKGLTRTDIATLSPIAVMAAIRNAKSAVEAVARLRRAASGPTARTANSDLPKLAALPLVAEVREWADTLRDDLAALRRGQIKADDIRYGVLEGPPGTGKSLLGEVLAQSAGWRFVGTSVPTWFSSTDGHLGGVTRAATEFFIDLLTHDFSIGFLDELQSIPDRSAMDASHREWWTTLVDLVLLQIDRVRKSGRPILLLGACNHYNHLDTALIRGGRLEQKITVRPPASVHEVHNVLRFYCGTAIDDGELEAIARLALGRAPADLAAGVKQARALARRAGRALVPADLHAGMDLSPERHGPSLEIVARHEAAHALIAHRLGAHVNSVTIVSAGMSAGATESDWGDAPMTRHMLEDRVKVALAGRVADEIFNGGASSGAVGDLAFASNLLRRGRLELGLYDRLGTIDSNGVMARFDGEWLEARLRWLMAETRALVYAERAKILELSDILLEKKVLDADEIVAALGVGK
ncbi:AAA family ATPase [Pelagibacterium flavum]|uniref:AAA family ATPase n=1 Tax=Pelagibacterium flavum TaxID=2984530 RepID=A0ABY6IPP1_9HYPH|nr:AAA family ATPase [Pelagibacterium sp. YIM 151497]UYQ72574.1 AAA family ATPase [Pelagibacterium sp. YIM 151497]